MLLIQRLLFIWCLLSLIMHVLSEDDKPKDPHYGIYGDIPRVKIKVFRGPTEEKNGETFAKWGFWVKQPRS